MFLVIFVYPLLLSGRSSPCPRRRRLTGRMRQRQISDRSEKCERRCGARCPAAAAAPAGCAWWRPFSSSADSSPRPSRPTSCAAGPSRPTSACPGMGYPILLRDCFYRVTHLVGETFRLLSSYCSLSWLAATVAVGMTAEHLNSKSMGGFCQPDWSLCTWESDL